MLAHWFPMAATAASFLVLAWAVKKLKSNSRPELPPLPGPRGLPIVGYLPFLGPNLHELLMSLTQIYGPIYKLPVGQRCYIIIGSPAQAKEVVRDQDITFANRTPTIAAAIFSYGGKDIGFQPYGPELQFLRRIFVQKMQSKEIVDSFYHFRRNEVEKTVRNVYDRIGQPINIGELAYVTVISMISGMFWGGCLEGERKRDIGVKFRLAASNLLELMGKPNVSDFFPILARFDLQGVERKTKEVTLELDSIYDWVIDERMKGDCNNRKLDGKNDGRKDFLGFLLEFKDEKTGRTISRQQIKALLMDIVVGGTDTTSTVVEWAMTELMLHPEVMRECQAELRRVIGVSNVVEEFHINQLPYLQAVVKETLRLHPVAPLLIPRSPSNSCHVGGYTIPKGTKVFLNVWAIHRDPQFWDSPLEFQPERFLNGATKIDYYGNHFHYLPFGSGRRICAGLPLGERMLMYVLATLVHMFNWEIPKGAKLDNSEKFGVVLKKLSPLVAIPTPTSSTIRRYENTRS